MTPSSTRSSYAYGPDGPRPDSEATPNGGLPRPLVGHPGWHPASRPSAPGPAGRRSPASGETANLARETTSRGPAAPGRLPSGTASPGQAPSGSRARPPSGRAATRADNPHKVPISGARGMTGDTTGAPAPARRPRFREMSAKQAATFTKYPARVLRGCRSMITETSHPIRRQSLRHKQSFRDHGRIPRPINAYKTEISAFHTPAAGPGPSRPARAGRRADEHPARPVRGGDRAAGRRRSPAPWGEWAQKTAANVW